MPPSPGARKDTYIHKHTHTHTHASVSATSGGEAAGALKEAAHPWSSSARQAPGAATAGSGEAGGSKMYESKRSFSGGAGGRVRKIVPNWHVGKFPSSTGLDELMLGFRSQPVPT